MSTIFFPRTIGIELVRGCNFACAMCPVTYNARLEQSQFQFINLALLERLVEAIDCWPSIETIWLFHFGEPMAHPCYRECLEMLNRSSVAHKALVIQHTNASLLNGDKAEAILDIPIIKKLVFSFDGFGDKESFERLRGPHFDHVMENIRWFSEQAAKRRPDLRLSTCTILPRKGEIPDLEVPDKAAALQRLHDLFDPLGVRVETRVMHNYSDNDPLTVKGNPPERVLGGCTFVENDSLFFTVNGWAQPCCAVYNEAFNVGKFPEQAFGELVNNTRMNHLRHILRLDRREGIPFCQNCQLSLGDALSNSALETFWKTRDQQGLVSDLTERRYIFGTLAPSKNAVIRLDLGCGTAKPGGFIGIDRFALPGVDLVADLNRPLPIADDSVDLVLASHSLEHLDDLMPVMREIYRICKHSAQVCIVAPYFAQSLNLANPHHKQNFNEHTARFWTATPHTPIESEEYLHPQARTWGLSQSDHNDPGVDFRCLRMEFFYFPEYRYLAPGEQRAARKKYMDVCDQIVYHLIVVKEPTSEVEMQELAKRIEYYEPPYVTVRRANERREFLETALAARQVELRQVREAHQVELQQVQEAHQAELLQAREAHQTELQQVQGAHQVQLQQVSNAHQAELQQVRKAQAELQQVQRAYQVEVEQVKGKAKTLADEMDFFRHRRVIRWLRRFRDRSDLRNDISPAFQQLKDDSSIFTPGLGSYQLQPSVNLQRVPFLFYPLDLNRPNLTGVLLAPILDLCLKNGVFGIEIVSPANQIVTQCVLPVGQINESAPTRFDFSPIRNSDQGRFWLRVFVRNVEASVRVFEWRKHRLFGLRNPKFRAFCGFLFKDTA